MTITKILNFILKSSYSPYFSYSTLKNGQKMEIECLISIFPPKNISISIQIFVDPGVSMHPTEKILQKFKNAHNPILT
jgi:hypothetical protein